MNGFGVDPVAIDLRGLIRRQVATLYTHLITRPTGRAVRMAIQSQLAEAGAMALSVVDFSQVRILDFSCADEVVAKLVLHYQSPRARPRAFFVFRGLGDIHLEPIQAVLERHQLIAVAETADRRCRLLGTPSEVEARIWHSLEERHALSPADLHAHLPDEADQRVLESLVQRGLAFRRPTGGDYVSLSRVMRSLGFDSDFPGPAASRA